MPSPCSGTLHAHQRPLANFARCRATAVDPAPSLSHPRATHVLSHVLSRRRRASPPAAKARLLGASPSFVVYPLCVLCPVSVPRVFACLVSLRASLLPAFFRTSIASRPTGFCCGAVSASLLVVSAWRLCFLRCPLLAQTLSLARPGVAQVTCDAPLSFCPRSPRHAHPSSPAEVSAALAAAVPPAFRRVQCRGAAFVGRLPARRHLFFVCDPAQSPSKCAVRRHRPTPCESLWCLRCCLPAVPVRPAAARRACSGGQRSASRTRPFATRSATLSASCHSAFSHAEAGVLWSLSIPWLAVLGRVVPAGCARQHSCGSQVPARASAASLGLMARPPRRRARHTLQALCCRLALRTPLRPLQSSLPCICGARRHAMRGPPTMAALLARKLGTHTHRGGADPVTAPRGDDTASFAWRERKAARRCLGTVARAFAQGSAKDRGGFSGRRAVQEGCWRQRFHSTETRGEPHTPKLRHGRHRERQVRGPENAEGVQCAPRHASPARSAVRRVALRAAAVLRPGAGCHARADSADRHRPCLLALPP
ncbi:hypothetical protein ERJ75_000899200 [Trypanosoma vivax]|nr:hypothetical protein ERJ75_000899200 [Trypanosoma vivax]